jgi:hypothetical protein
MRRKDRDGAILTPVLESFLARCPRACGEVEAAVARAATPADEITCLEAALCLGYAVAELGSPEEEYFDNAIGVLYECIASAAPTPTEGNASTTV